MVLFLISSGLKIGIGHVKRCVQLACDLRDRHMEAVLCLENDPASIAIISNSNLGYIVLNEKKKIATVLAGRPEIRLVVMDMLDVSKKDTDGIKKIRPGLPILALDYFDMRDPNVNTVINLFNHNKTEARPLSKAVKYMEGPAYGILRTEFAPLIAAQKKKEKAQLQNILVTFGGSDPQQHTLAIIPVLEKILSGWDVMLTFVIGPNFVHGKQISDALEHTTLKYAVVNNPPGMAQLMSDADLCICGSGTTILELAALGTPALVLPQSPEELSFSRVFELAGFAVIAGTPGTIDTEKLKQALNRFYNAPQTLAAAGIAGRQLCDGKGKERIVNEMIMLLKN